MKKIKLINKLNKSYYDKSKPEITDKEYDNKKQILILGISLILKSNLLHLKL